MKISSNPQKPGRREFLKGLGALPLLGLAAPGGARAAESKLTAAISKKEAKILIVGGGMGGIDAAARLRRAAPKAKITLVTPNDVHLYQPGQIFVAAGLGSQSENRRATSELLADGVTWIKDAVVDFDPANRQVTTEKEKSLSYDVLVVAMGAVHDFGALDGVEEALAKGSAASVYLNDTRKGQATGGERTREWFEKIAHAAASSKQRVLFCVPSGPTKAINATLDMLLLGNDMFAGRGPGRMPNVKHNVEITLAVGNERIIPSKPFDEAVRKILKKAGNVKVLTGYDITGIDESTRTATFTTEEGDMELGYDFVHVAPPIRPPEAVAESDLAAVGGEFEGFLEVDPVTLRHKRYDNVFGLGDVTALPAKSGGATRDMAIVIQDNVANALENRPLDTRYTGYNVAPVKTRYGREMLVEYDRRGPAPTFPLDPTEPRWVWWELDLHLLRWSYFNLMMHGLL